MESIRLPNAKYVKSTLENIEYKVGVSYDLIDLFLKSFAQTQVGEVTTDTLLKSYDKLYIMLTGTQQILDGALSEVDRFSTYLEQHSA